MRVLVCGGRNFSDTSLFGEAVERFAPCVTLIIHGGAAGADEMADNWGIWAEIPVECYEADWKRYGNSAGPIRNQQMIDEGKPDLVLAFPGGRGTADMVRRAKAAGIPVEEIGRPATSMERAP